MEEGIENMDGDGRITLEDNYDRLTELAADKSLLHLVGLLTMPNIQFCFVKLEYGYFPPLTPENKDFSMIIVKWEEQLFGVASFPRKYADEALDITHGLGLYFADGVPTMLTVGAGRQPQQVLKEARHFPMQGENVFMLQIDDKSPKAITGQEIAGGLRVINARDAFYDELKRINAWLAERGFGPING